MNYDDGEKVKITLSFQKNPENDGTSRVDISGLVQMHWKLLLVLTVYVCMYVCMYACMHVCTS